MTTVAGGGGNVTIIKSEGAALNWFIGIQGEPGETSQYFHFDCWRGPDNVGPCNDSNHDVNVQNVHNTVIGHDNCGRGSFSADPTFVYIDHGEMHLGDFNGTALNYSQTMQVMGPAFISELTHGLPTRREAQSEDGAAAQISAVDEEPMLLGVRPSSGPSGRDEGREEEEEEEEEKEDKKAHTIRVGRLRIESTVGCAITLCVVPFLSHRLFSSHHSDKHMTCMYVCVYVTMY